jgi:glycosyltransferase involved in cell wall biosynthesis
VTRKFRILHLIDHLCLGGAQRTLLDLIAASDRTRFEHEVACLHGKGVEWDAFTAARVVVHSLSPKKWNPVHLVRLATLLRSGRYDALHCHLFYSNVLGKPLAAALGMRHRFCHVHGNDRPSTGNTWMRVTDRLAHRLSTHVFAVSPFIGAYLIKTQGLPPERVSVVPNGIDLKRFLVGREFSAEARRRHGLPEQGPIVGAVARLSGQKNLPVFLRAAARVLEQRPDATFILAGSGEDEVALKREAERLRLGERCRFLGHVPDMPHLYPAMDVKVLPSIFEGFGLVICEALLCGVAVVASTVAGARDYLRDGEDCFFVPPHDDATFAARILQLLDDPALRERQTQSARRVIEAELSSTGMAQRVEKIYAQHLTPDSRALVEA